MRWKAIAVFAAIAAALLVPVSAQAALVTLSTADGNGADSMVSQFEGHTNEDQDVNYGADGRIWARTSSSNGRFQAIFVRFDISDYVSGSFTGTPTLGLTKWRDDDTGTDLIVYGLNESVDTWIEGNGGTDNSPVGELTYNNAPGIAQDSTYGDNDVDLGEVTELVSDAEGFQLTGDEGQEITVSDADFLTFLNADTDGLVTFIVARTDDNNGIDDIATKETTDLATTTITLGSGAPTLTFEGVPVPEPASLALLAAGGLAAIRRRRSA
jgi:hypothetical protein